MVPHELVGDVRRKLFERQTVQSRELLQNVSGQDRDIFQVTSQRLGVNRNDLEAVVQVLTESAGRDFSKIPHVCCVHFNARPDPRPWGVTAG